MEERYHREQRRDAVALRMIGFEARTRTISICTGLSDENIRRLYRYYIASDLRPAVTRHRGKSPRQLNHFTRNQAALLESSMLATALAAHRLLRTRKGRQLRENTLEYGEAFCDAYGDYRKLPRVGQLSFEHAWFFRRALLAGNELGLDHCGQCGGFYVRDMLSVALSGCPLCRFMARPARSETRRVRVNPLMLLATPAPR
jgi:hypothetical protein